MKARGEPVALGERRSVRDRGESPTVAFASRG
jgi:hypothetical protein